MASSSSAQTGGIGFGGALLLLCVGLKLTGYITWPWVWVLAPMWVPLLILLAVFLVIILAYSFGKQ